MKGAAAEPYREFPAKATGNNRFDAYPNITDWYETIKLNYGVDYQNGGTCHFDPIPDTWTKMLDIMLFWAGKNIDGFRCDMAEMVPVEFWGMGNSAGQGTISLPAVYSRSLQPGRIQELLVPWQV